MHTLFNSSEKPEKKTKRELIAKTNQQLHATFNQAFSEIYPSAREELLRGGACLKKKPIRYYEI